MSALDSGIRTLLANMPPHVASEAWRAWRAQCSKLGDESGAAIAEFLNDEAVEYAAVPALRALGWDVELVNAILEYEVRDRQGNLKYVIRPERKPRS
jgi:hypothetical protein